MEDVGLRAKIAGAQAYITDAKKIQAETNKIGDSVQGAARTANAASSSIVSSMKGIGIAVVAAFAVQKVTSFVQGTISAASNLNETVNKSQVVFGRAADAVLKFGDTAATAMGQSKQQAIEAAASFGNLFLSAGLNQQAAANMSTGLVQLASDLASFNNIDPTLALEKLRSGLVGEVEPLRTLGVLLSEQAVSEKAVQLGLAKTTDNVSQAAKVQARYALILEQTKTAQGDFAATSTGLANATRILNASWADIEAQIGQAFLPAVAGLTSALAVALPKAFKATQDAVSSVQQTLQPFWDSITAAVGPVLGTLGTAISAVVKTFADFAGGAAPSVLAILQQVGDVLFRISPVVKLFQAEWAALQSVWQSVSANTGAVSGAMSGLEGILKTVSDALKAVADPAGVVMTTLRDVAAVAEGAFNTMADIALPILAAIRDALINAWADIAPLIEPAIAGVVTMIQNALNAILPVVQGVLGAISQFWTDHGNDILIIVKTVWEQIGNIVGTAIALVSTVIGTVLKLIAGDWQGAWDEIGKVPEIVWEFIVDTVKNLGTVLYRVTKTVVQALRLEDAWYGIRDFVLKIWNDIVNGIKGRLNDAIDLVNGFIDGINAVFGMLNLQTFGRLGRFDINEFMPPPRPGWFADEANKELDLFNANVDKAKQKSFSLSDALSGMFRGGPAKVDASQFIKVITPQREFQAAGDAATAMGDKAKGALDAAKQAADAAKDSLAGMKDNLSALKDEAGLVAKQLNAAEDAMRGFASVRLPGMGAAEDEIFDLEIAAKKARLAELGVGDAGQQAAKDVKNAASDMGAGFDMLAAQQEELATGIPVAVKRAEFEAQQARQAANRAAEAAAAKSKGDDTQTESDRINKLIEIKRLQMEIAFGPQQRALQQHFEGITGASKETTFAEAIKGMDEAAAKAVILRDAQTQIANAIGLQEDAINAQEDIVKELDDLAKGRSASESAIATKIREQNISLGDQQTTLDAILNSKTLALGLDDQALSYAQRQREQMEETLRLQNEIAATRPAPTPLAPQGGFGGGGERFAEGGISRGGLALVGERGPELAVLPSGTNIIPNNRLAAQAPSISRTFNDQWNIQGVSQPVDVWHKVQQELRFARIRQGR